jgi:hypothetical protein
MKMTVQTRQKQALLGRLKMADWIEMPEREFAREIADIERDPLFKKLHFGGAESPGVIRRQRWPRGRMAGSFFEFNEAVLAGGERVRVEELLAEGDELMPKIRKMGREAFEKFFLFADEALPVAELAKRTGLTVREVEEVNDLLLKIGAEAEFVPARLEAAPASGQVCLARLSMDGGDPEFEFFSPYWARGLYQVRYDLLETLKGTGALAPPELKKLPRLLKRLETVNLRQNTVFRIMESVTKLQAGYLGSRREDEKLPISLRMLARRLDLAPSTVSRAIAGRSVLLPWGKEAALIRFLPGRRRVLRDILSLWFKDAQGQPDSFFADKLRQERGIRVSRRTVNAVRNELFK